jgi:hypothetical protein
LRIISFALTTSNFLALKNLHRVAWLKVSGDLQSKKNSTQSAAIRGITGKCAPEKRSIVHPFRNKLPLLLKLLLQLVERVLLWDGEIPQSAWWWLVAGIGGSGRGHGWYQVESKVLE